MRASFSGASSRILAGRVSRWKERQRENPLRPSKDRRRTTVWWWRMRGGTKVEERERERESVGEGESWSAVCKLCMRAKSPTGFKTTQHPASRQMCSMARDKTRDDSSSFVKPFSGLNGDRSRGREGYVRNQWNLRWKTPPSAFLLRGRVITQEEYVSRRTFLAALSETCRRGFQPETRASAWAEYISYDASSTNRPLSSLLPNVTPPFS